ncbi:hypothetical protein [Nostoc sp.]|uniref:hypothetical protein n=1 Tax=Nostoc sp. TaxID=1180 RepID=UPI002FFB9C9F
MRVIFPIGRRFTPTSFTGISAIAFLFIIEPFCKVAKLLLHYGDSLMNKSGKLR